MRFKVLLIVLLVCLASFGLGQDINRASEWKTKRPEQPAAKVETEMTMNGTVAPKGQDPAVLDQNGDPLGSKLMQSEKMSATQKNDENAVRQQSERLTQASFDTAGSSVATEEERKASPLVVGGICLFVAALVVLAFRILTKRIEVPEETLAS